MFIKDCFIRNPKNKIDLIIEVDKLGYTPMYMNPRNNLGGSNLVCEFQTWHCTDSDNKPDAIDCKNNEVLFLAIAALRDDTDKNQWFIYDTMDCVVESMRKIDWIKCEEDKIEDFMFYDCAYLNCRKATVNELIKHFSHEE